MLDDQVKEHFTLSEDTVNTRKHLLDLFPPWQVLDRLIVR